MSRVTYQEAVRLIDITELAQYGLMDIYFLDYNPIALLFVLLLKIFQFSD